METFFSQIWKFIYVAQSLCRVIHQGTGTGSFLVTSKNLDIGHYERNWKDFKHVQHGQRLCLPSDSSNKQDMLYVAAKMQTNSIMGIRCVNNCTDMMVDIGLYNIVHIDREPRYSSIFNAWVEDWE